MKRKLLVLPALLGLTVSALAGCGGSDSGSGGDGTSIVVGTTDSFAVTKETPAPLDPATGYDIGTWNVFNNTFQTLLRFPGSGSDPEPEAAESCAFTDDVGELYRCTLRSGLEFSNGDALTSEDVKFSIERMLEMKNESGPYSLLTNIDKIEAPKDNQVVFHLKDPDTTFPFKIATPAAAIVDSEVYKKKELQAGFELVGSGPYKLASWKEGEAAVFEKNPDYKGSITLNNSRVELKFFKTSAEMEKALKAGDIDVMNRTMSPDRIKELETGSDDNLKLTEAPGAEIRYLVFNTADTSVEEPAVRKAVAQLVDRQAIARDVYERTTEPLYSIVPQGITAHVNSFYNTYKDPSKAAARKTLRDAGITAKVPLTLAYTTDHYGEVTAEEFELLKKQLDASGLFDVTLKGVPWREYQIAARAGQYAVFGMGWFPDFPDADNYIAPFFGADNFLKLAYVNNEIRDNLLPQTRQKAERSSTVGDFEKAQDEIALDVPVLPIWQGKQYIAARHDITGTEWALNSSSATLFWELGRRSD